ncbi:MAG: hypothetical protein ACO225_02360 [Ilumatobacteraceae bacterium]
METRRNEWRATIRLAIAVSSIGVAVAVAVERAGVLPQHMVVFGVIGVGFSTSWVRSGRRSLQRAL